MIDAETGEVVWSRNVSGQSEINMNFLDENIKFGSDKLSNKDFSKAMDKVAENVVDALTEFVE